MPRPAPMVAAAVVVNARHLVIPCMQPFRLLLHEQLAGRIPVQLLDILPSGYQRIGSIILLRLPPALQPHRNLIGQAVLRSLPGVTTVCAQGRVSGELRLPSITVLAGNGTETLHQEHGCRFRLDVREAMFSKGNVFERGRLLDQIRPQDTIVDMFAGIGYFSLPIARHMPSARVYAIEKSPRSFRWLRENIRLNRLWNVLPVSGDCRIVSLPEQADHAIMGYLPGTAAYLPAAFRFLKPAGTVHYHDVFPAAGLWKQPREAIKHQAAASGFRAKILHERVVKHYGPGKEHVVLDVAVQRIS